MEGQATERADAGCERAGVVGAERAPGLGAGGAQRPAAGRGPGAARGRAAVSCWYAGADVHAGGKFAGLTSTAYGRTRLLPAADQASASPSSPAKRARADPVDPQRAALELHSQRTLKAMLQYVLSSLRKLSAPPVSPNPASARFLSCPQSKRPAHVRDQAGARGPHPRVPAERRRHPHVPHVPVRRVPCRASPARPLTTKRCTTVPVRAHYWQEGALAPRGRAAWRAPLCLPGLL